MISTRVDRSAGVKASIRDAAARLFADRGFSATGVREIAREAGVDPSIVIRHFGSKENLFLATMTLPASWSELFEGRVEEIGPRVASMLLTGDGEGMRIYAALVRASDREDVRERLDQIAASLFVEPLSRRLDPAEGPLRARLFTLVIEGLMSALAVREDPVLTAMDREELAEKFGAMLQGTLTGHRMGPPVRTPASARR